MIASSVVYSTAWRKYTYVMSMVFVFRSSGACAVSIMRELIREPYLPVFFKADSLVLGCTFVQRESCTLQVHNVHIYFCFLQNKWFI